MSKLIFVSILLLLYAESTKSLTKSAVRELTGLHSKANRYLMPASSNGTVFPKVSKACKAALFELLKSPSAMLVCKYDDFDSILIYVYCLFSASYTVFPCVLELNNY